ncbi:MAG: hypothetical protein OK442_05090 [Thaumarchaeota archaeon]|nr:hypothetical protein [Nitrososphaerota archaeon]
MVLERGFFFMVLKNIGDEPAANVVTKIGGKIIGPDGKKTINDLNIFRSLEFIPPGREFRILVGSAQTYFANKQPTKLTAVMTYSDGNKNTYGETISHDLSIYADLPRELERD